MAWLGALPPDPQDLSLWGQDGSQQGTNKRRNRTFHLSKKPDILTCQEQYEPSAGYAVPQSCLHPTRTHKADTWAVLSRQFGGAGGGTRKRPGIGIEIGTRKALPAGEHNRGGATPLNSPPAPRLGSRQYGSRAPESRPPGCAGTCHSLIGPSVPCLLSLRSLRTPPPELWPRLVRRRFFSGLARGFLLPRTGEAKGHRRERD